MKKTANTAAVQTVIAANTATVLSEAYLKKSKELFKTIQEVYDLAAEGNRIKKLLDDAKARLEAILPPEGATIEDVNDKNNQIIATWRSNTRKTLQTALVEQALGFKLPDDWYKITPSTFVSVTNKKNA